jgi:hypothetical protein
MAAQETQNTKQILSKEKKGGDITMPDFYTYNRGGCRSSCLQSSYFRSDQKCSSRST